MNKYIKLSLIFIFVIGVVIVISRNSEIVPHPIVDPSTELSVLREYIKDSWKDKDTWDSTIYNDCMEKISKSYRKGSIKMERDYHRLFDFINSEAINTIDDFFDAEMKKSNCDNNEIKNGKNGLDFIIAYKNPYDDKHDVSSDNRIIKLNDMYEQYMNIIAFCDKDFSVAAKINKECKWKDFGDYVNQLDKEKSDLENGLYYTSHFSKIEKVKNAWSSYGAKIEQSKQKYYNDLSDLIKQYFNKRYNDYYEFEKNQAFLIDKHNELSGINSNLKNEYNDVRAKYNSIDKKYTIEKKLKNINDEISNCRTGSKKYNEWVDAKNRYITALKRGNDNNINLKQRIDKLVSNSESYNQNIDNLNYSIGVHQDKMSEFDNDLKTVIKEFYSQSSQNILNQYYHEKDDQITTMVNNIPMISKIDYISYLKDYSKNLNEIINYVDNL